MMKLRFHRTTTAALAACACAHDYSRLSVFPGRR
jgi:hypothetical protein